MMGWTRMGVGALALGLAGCASEPMGESSDRPPAPLPRGVFDARVVVEPRERGDIDHYERVGALDFRMVTTLADEDELVLGAAVRGELTTTRLREQADASRGTADASGTVLTLHAGTSCERLVLQELELVADGEGFRGRGRGVLDSEECGADYTVQTEVTIELTAVPDRRAPRLESPVEAHPLQRARLATGEPLTPESAVDVRVGDGRTLQLAAPATSSSGFPDWGFELPPLLAFDAVADWSARGADLAGNELLGQGQIITPADPGFLPQDGFESDVPYLGKPPIFGEMALSGARSLLIDEYQRITFHLRRGEGTTTLRFDAQVLVPFADLRIEEATTADVIARIGVVGGARVLERSLAARFGPDPGDAALPALEVVEVPLTEAGDSVIVTFEMAPFDDDCGLAECIGLTALIDDLRIE